jgi:hypothetical protein
LHEGAIVFGLALIITGLVMTVLAGVQHWFSLQRLRQGGCPNPGPLPLSIVAAMLLAVLCMVGLWTLYVR